MKTYSQKASEVNHAWIEVDAASAPLGRLATVIATRLTGKYKPTYTPHIDDGDYVVVINAEKAIVTGGKETDKMYYNYSGFPGGLTEANLAKVRKDKPERIIMDAVFGMLPKNKLQAERMKRLRIFVGESHTHAPQKPVKVEVK
jgi:large subunit ribosomal protein L13